MPTDQYFEAFLHMAASTDTAMPAPFSWVEWTEYIADTVPPWALSATPENSGVPLAKIQQIQAFAQGYYALSAAKDRTAYCLRRGPHNNLAGREAFVEYLSEKWALWGINDIVDSLLKANDIDVFTMAEPGMLKLYPLDLSPVVGLYRDIAVKFFGDDAYQNSLMVKEPATRFVRTLCAAYWKRMRSKLSRERVALKKAETAVERERDAFEKLPIPTAAAGMRYIRALELWLNRLSKWKVDHLGQKHDDVKETLEGIRDELQGVPSVASKKLPAALSAALATLATSAECAQVLGSVMELLEAHNHDEEQPVLRGKSDELEEWKDGVEEYTAMPIELIARALGLAGPHVPFFNKSQDPIGELDPWSEDGIAALQADTAEPLEPRWHQWVGALKIMDNLFDHKHLLIMDEVGVGKTMQAVAAIAMYEYQRLQYQKYGKFTDRFAKYTGTKNLLNCTTHILVVPPGLIQQWIMELHRYLQRGSFSVLPYTGNCSVEGRQTFWKLYDTVPKPAIILVASTAAKSDLDMFFQKPTKGVRPKASHACAKGLVSNTLFSVGRDYGILGLDEVHYGRTFNKYRAACVELAERARMTIAMTATPVMTSPMDLVNIATILNIPGIVDAEMQAFKRSVERARRQERKKRMKGKGDVRLARSLALGKYTKDAGEDEVKNANREWILRLRDIYEGYMMRRTIYSKDNNGDPISGLPPWFESSILVDLTPREMEVQRLLAENLAEEGVSVAKNAVGSFYLNIRQALLHPGFCKLTDYAFDKADESKPYSEHPSTKIDAVLKLLEWHLGHCCRKPVTYQDGELTPVPDDQWSWDSSRHDLPDDKIIIYLAFPSLNWLIQSALEAKDIQYQEINGCLTAPQRSVALKEFRTDLKCNVLLLSGVGMCGLNMAFANIIIIVDNLWSAQEDQQLIGRVSRFPQPKLVTIYRIIARHTSDVFLNNIGFQKGTLHAEFSGIETTLRHAFEPSEAAYESVSSSEDESSESGDEKDSGKAVGKKVTNKRAVRAVKAPQPNKKAKTDASSEPFVALAEKDAYLAAAKAKALRAPRRKKSAAASVKSAPTVADTDSDEEVEALSVGAAAGASRKARPREVKQARGAKPSAPATSAAKTPSAASLAHKQASRAPLDTSATQALPSKMSASASQTSPSASQTAASASKTSASASASTTDVSTSNTPPEASSTLKTLPSVSLTSKTSPPPATAISPAATPTPQLSNAISPAKETCSTSPTSSGTSKVAAPASITSHMVNPPPTTARPPSKSSPTSGVVTPSPKTPQSVSKTPEPTHNGTLLPETATPQPKTPASHSEPTQALSATIPPPPAPRSPSMPAPQSRAVHTATTVRSHTQEIPRTLEEVREPSQHARPAFSAIASPTSSSVISRPPTPSEITPHHSGAPPSSAECTPKVVHSKSIALSGLPTTVTPAPSQGGDPQPTPAPETPDFHAGDDSGHGHAWDDSGDGHAGDDSGDGHAGDDSGDGHAGDDSGDGHAGDDSGDGSDRDAIGEQDPDPGNMEWVSYPAVPARGDTSSAHGSPIASSPRTARSSAPQDSVVDKGKQRAVSPNDDSGAEDSPRERKRHKGTPQRDLVGQNLRPYTRNQVAMLGLGLDVRPTTLADLPPAGGSARGGKRGGRTRAKGRQ